MVKKQGAKRSSFKRVFGFLGLGSTALYGTAAVAGSLSIVYIALQVPDSLVASWLIKPFTATSTSSSDGSIVVPVGATTTTSTAPQPAADPATPAVLPTKVGIDVDWFDYWTNGRPFMNLLAGSKWMLQGADGSLAAIPADRLDNDQNVVALNSGEKIVRLIARPTASYQGRSVDVTCRWQGTANVTLPGQAYAKSVTVGNHMLKFTYLPTPMGKAWPVLKIDGINPADPVKHLDCREADADSNQLFDPTFLNNMKRYKLIRFMKWQHVESNLPVDWATRTRPESGVVYGDDGVPIEYIISLCNQLRVDCWFNVNWNASDDYIHGFAKMVHDRLDPSLKAYVELSDEVWNPAYPVTKQAREEGLAEGLAPSTQATKALLYRVAEKTVHVMDIWKQEFAGAESRLVRTVATQNSSPWATEQVLSYGDTPSHVDAVTTAPYFPLSLDQMTIDPNDLSNVFAALRDQIDLRLGQAVQQKDTAAKYGLRFVAYEAGQSVWSTSDVELQRTVQRDPRMGDLYRSYLARWQQDIGDLIVMFADVGATNKYGAWGLQEYPGQPLTETPKLQAVNAFLASIDNH